MDSSSLSLSPPHQPFKRLKKAFNPTAQIPPSSNGSDGTKKVSPQSSNGSDGTKKASSPDTSNPRVEISPSFINGFDGSDEASDPTVEISPSFINGSDGSEKASDPTVEISPSFINGSDGSEKASDPTVKISTFFINGFDGSEKASDPTVEISPFLSNSFDGSEKASDPTVEISPSFINGSDGSEKASDPTVEISPSFSNSFDGSEKASDPTVEISPSFINGSDGSEKASDPTVEISPSFINGSDGSDKASDPTVEIAPSLDGLDGSEKRGGRREAKRVLDFGDVAVEENLGGLGKGFEEGFSDNKEKIKNKNKKRSRSGGDDKRGKSAVPNKKREEKERKMYLQQLHAESQKLLRETRDATFKPIPIVHKPISSVLEKIRKRKLEVMKKTSGKNNNCSFSENNAPIREHMTLDDSENVSTAKNNNCSFSENNAPISENMTNDDLENISTAKREADKSPKVLQDQTVPCEGKSDSSLTNGLEETLTKMEDEDCASRMVLDEQPMHAFRAPVDDTQDLFSDSQTSEGKEDMSSHQNCYPLEEDFAPSLLAMNLKFDSAPPDDISSDDEDDDKENVKPAPTRADYECASPKGDPVKAFVDEEAEEEDNSDNDMRFNENEEEDIEDYEELKDLIATGYEENAVDNDMRNELHQKWLEQQDETGTDNLMQRLKYGSKLKQTTLFEDEDEEDEEDFYDEAAKDPSKASVARATIKKAKQIIPQLFSDKNNDYFSDEEEAEKRITKQRVLGKVEEQTTLVPPAEDENSREVFGLIKKLNIMPDTKKKAKTSSIFDKMLTATRINGTGFSKSSFVGRKGNHSVSSSTKKGTNTVRSFIFERDDSNSRSSLSVVEDSSDIIIEETRPTRNVTTKISSSQFKYSSQITKSTVETSMQGSLFNILKRSSVQSSVSTVDLTQNVFDVFKIPKTSMRIE